LIDFSNIHAFNNGNGQRDSFEELICILAKRAPPEGALEFRPNEGRGGDGGIEALWILDDGKKIGYQAKFFLSLEDIQWKQMDKSVRQALKVHPELQKYIFAIPRDLTPDTGGKRSSQWQKWDKHVKKWKEWAEEQSIEIEFELWSETTLKDMLLKEGNEPLIRFWFGNDVLVHGWFEAQTDAAKRTLDDRFNPDDHVEVSVESLFDSMARGSKISEKLRVAFLKLEKMKIPDFGYAENNHAASPELICTLVEARLNLLQLSNSFSHDFTTKWDVSNTRVTLECFSKASWELDRHLLLIDKQNLEPEYKTKIERTSEALRKITSFCSSFSKVLGSTYLQAELLQCSLVHGPAGVGKSHILGVVAEQRICMGLPTVLVLGQSLSNMLFWEQVGGVLGLEARTGDEVLGLLNAVGERKGERVFLLFDAINEGVGADYWRKNLTDIVSLIQKYPYLSAVFSCRDEYIQYAIPESLLDQLPRFEIKGFSTPEEIELAAIKYLDRKGIARPNTPWLSPEFSNPLFLKTVSESLLAKGHNEFPRGLHGISSLMALYLDALNLRTGISASSLTSQSIKQCVSQIANRMADRGDDYIEIEEAISFAEDSFKNRTPPEGKTWLDVLIETSVFRRDPAPFADVSDPFEQPSERIRFAFQRFQDHLMAKSLANKVQKNNLNEAFDDGGVLNFLFYHGLVDNGLNYKYAGLISALSTIYPEQFDVEFAQTLPDWEKLWEEGQLLQEGFCESFKWRKADAFLEETRELVNHLNDNYVDRLGLLLEVSMTIDHPFNAFFLHTFLIKRTMPERDSIWTRWINWNYCEDFNQLERVVSWALSLLERRADMKHLELASIVLTWFLSSSHNTLRDRATKALVTLFLSDARVFDFLLDLMCDCDDPYVIERLYAAAFGACCIDQSSERLRSYSDSVFGHVFSDKQPPIALLTRDYALGIIELAESKGALSCEISLKDCFPPFDSDGPKFGLTEKQVEAIAIKHGGKEIFFSASNEWGDFGKYTVPGCVSGFLTTSLDKAPPISKTDLKNLCIQELITPYPERVSALDNFEKENYVTDIEYLSIITEILGKNNDDCEVSNKNNEKSHESENLKFRIELESLLNEEERERLTKEYFHDEAGYEEFDKIDVQQCRLWITKRAYELGWNSDLFNNDSSLSNSSRHDNTIERIGKKYQHIALDEIQARLADNYWLLHGYPEKPGYYYYSHVDYRRNIEPTILPSTAEAARNETNLDHWIMKPSIELPEVAEKELKQWPFEEDPTESIVEKLSRTDEAGKKWTVLYEFNINQQKYQGSTQGEHNMRYEEFRFLYCIFVRRGKAKELAEFLKVEQSIDVHSFKPRDYTDGPFLGEAHWRSSWAAEKFSEYLHEAPENCQYSIPVANYTWESHLDKSLPNGLSCYLPEKWFAHELGLSMSGKGPKAWVDQFDQNIIQTHGPFDNQTAVVIDEDALCFYAENYDIQPMWIMISERNTWPGGNNSQSCWRRSEGVVWREEDDWNQYSWNKDTKR
jgi:hypothetical protein